MTTALGLQSHIWNNNFKSILLLLGFPFLLLLMLWGYFAATAGLETGQGYYGTAIDPVQAGIDGVLRYGHIAIGAALAWFGISYFSHQAMINRATGARPVTRQEEPHIYNLLENLCISRGIPTPKLCIIDSPVLNAYASGIDQKTFTITLTRGIVDALDDKELEAVLAHELSHIINRDVRLLIIAVVFVGMISFFSEMAFRSLRYASFRSGGGKRNGGITILIAFIILMIGYVFAILIRFALSRKREYLADAGAVELTKQPEALISALEKISGNADMPHAPAEVRQMFIENRSEFASLFATHPPMEKRIAVLKALAGTEYRPHQSMKQALPKGPWG